MRKPFIREILERLAPRLGAQVSFHPDGFVGYIVFGNGRRSLFWDNKFNLNPVSSAKIAQDKAYTSHLLKSSGIRVPEERVFFRETFREYAPGKLFGARQALKYARSLGFPVFLKPNRMSQGRLVEKALSASEFLRAAADIFAVSRVLLVQRPCIGRDYRLIVLDGAVISAYERVPLSVVGDGVATIRDLLALRQAKFDATGRDTVIPVGDPRLRRCLAREGLTLTSTPAAGQRVRLFDAANLSLGGATVDRTTRLHSSFGVLAGRVATLMDLRFCGVDLIAKDVTKAIDDYTVLEVNSAPGLDNYLFAGRRNTEYVDELYRRVLRAVESGPRV